MHTHTYLGNFCPKKALDWRSALVWHKNILAPGVRATDFSGPAYTMYDQNQIMTYKSQNL